MRAKEWNKKEVTDSSVTSYCSLVGHQGLEPRTN